MKNRGVKPGTKSRLDETFDEIETNDVAESPAEEDDPTSYRDFTKEEVLEGVAEGVRDFLAGKYRPADECYDELGWQLPDDETQSQLRRQVHTRSQEFAIANSPNGA